MLMHGVKHTPLKSAHESHVMQTIENKVKGKFSIIPNAIWADKRLSADSMAMLCYLLSKPTGWKIRESDVRAVLGFGKDKYQATMRLLKGCGYILKSTAHNKDGSFAGHVFAILPTPLHKQMPEESGKCKRACDD